MINIFKKWWFWLIVFFGILTIYGAVVGINQAKEEIESETVATEVDPEEEVAEEVEDAGDWDEFKNFDNIVGKSDKDFMERFDSRPTQVRNDSTGNWYLTRVSENENVLEYIMSYYETHMTDGEVHHIVNYTLNTTTQIVGTNGLLTVDVKERVDREEHDASTLGSGTLLTSYSIYPDGDIERKN